MDAPFSDSELIDVTRGMAYDTATLLDDVARRLNPHSARYVRTLVNSLRECADELNSYAKASPDPQASGQQASEASTAAAVQPQP